MHVVHTLLSSLTTSSPLSNISTLARAKSTQMSPDGALNPFITSHYGEDAEWPNDCSHLPLYKPLKPTFTNNERPAQSVSNPVPIWTRLPWASFAFVLWLSEGRALHAPAQLQAFIKNALWVAVKKRSQPVNLITGWGPSTYVNLHLFLFKERDSPGLSCTQTPDVHAPTCT